MSDWYKMNPVDWNEGTNDLTLEQEAAYLRICNAMYIASGPISNNQFVVAGLLRCNDRRAKRIVSELVAAGKISIEGGLIHNKRALDELSNRRRLSVERELAGRRGGIESGKARRNSLENNETAEANASSKTNERREEESREKEEAKASSKKPEDRKGSRLPLDWQPSPELRQFARKQGLSESQITLEAEKFRDYWKSVGGAKGCKLDWDATWRNWVRNSNAATPGAAGAEAPPTAESLTEAEWANTMRRWLDTGEWLADGISPPPDQPGCMAPTGMLRFAAKEAPEFADAIRQNLPEDRAA